MFLFYSPLNVDGSIVLSEDELRHATKTLRKRVGDEVWSTDGLGGKYKSRIKAISKSSAALEILDRTVYDIPVQQLHMAIALTKNASRLEWFLEKATEIGVQEITPLITSRTEKKSFKKNRGEKIVTAAMKQSLRFYLPKLNEAKSVEELLEAESSSVSDKYVCHYKEGNRQLKDAITEGHSATILIGPEGDFTDKELTMIIDRGFTSINLGDHRLRTETAGIVACHTFNIINHG